MPRAESPTEMREEQEPWMGHVQRARLSGFAKLRAIMWRRSLRLYEAWSLRHLAWPRVLRRKLALQFANSSLHDPERCQKPSDIFGETPILTLVKLLEVIDAVSPVHPAEFVDLGSGRGLTCLVAASMGYSALGYEKESAWCEKATLVSQQLSLSARFQDGDFFAHDWPSKAVYFLVATAFPQTLREELERRFLELDSGSLFVVGDWKLSSDFEALWQGKLPVDWGVIPFVIYRSSASGAATAK